ncbi:hypothetical protein ABZ769_13210 [Streptomyces olivoreticuli]
MTITATTPHASSPATLSTAPHAGERERLTGDVCAEPVIGFL